MNKEVISQRDKVRDCIRKGDHYLLVRRDIGHCRFLNTGKPYMIEQCVNCKAEYVRDL